MKLSISAILPNYNYAPFLIERLNSILSQSYPISELIILDDCSTDNSVEIIEQEIEKLKLSRPNLKVIFEKNSKNSGNVFSQWQKGISLATGDYLWIAEADDSCDDDFLKILISKLDSNVVLAYSNSNFLNENGLKNYRRTLREFYNRLKSSHWKKDYRNDGKKEIKEVLCIYNTIPNVSAVIFKNDNNLLKLLDEAKDFRLAGDWYFYYKVLLTGDIIYCSKKINTQRIHESSVTKTTNHELHLSEIKKLHSLIGSELNLPKESKLAMQKYENYLKKHWGL